MQHLIATAQITAAEAETLWSSPRFFAAIFAGLVIAMALQLLLTNLSVAIGATAAKEMTEGSAESSADEGVDIGEAIRGVNRGYGIWALVTGALSLFIGAWLGVELSLTVDPTAGMVLGLAIWALFFFAMFFVELSIVGAVVRTASSGLKSAGASIGSLVGRSESRERSDAAREVAAAVRDELLEDRRLQEIGRNVARTVDEIKRTMDPRALRSELETLVGRTEFEAHTDSGEDGEREVTASLKTRPGPSKSTVKAAADVASRAREAVNDGVASGRSPVENAAEAAMRTAGVTAEDAQAYRERFEGYLRETNTDELDPDGIKADLERLFEDPRAGWEALKERFAGANRGTLTSILVSRGLDEERAEAITAQAQDILASLAAGMNGASGSVSARAALGEKVQNYLKRVDDPALRYDELRTEFELLLDDPSAGAKALAERLRRVDRESIKSLISARANGDEEQAERIVGAFDSALEAVAERAEKASREIERRTARARELAANAAEETRRTVSTAAWWAFAAGVGSAAAAAIGGMLAVITGVG